MSKKAVSKKSPKSAKKPAARPPAKSARPAKGGESASELIDARIKDLNDWRGETLARVRSIIRQADPDVVETWKWRGVPV
jgi:hypothetical protein